MKPEGPGRVERPLLAILLNVAGALLIVSYRVATRPFHKLWYDWVVLLSLYWIFTVLGSRTKAWPAVTLGTALGLLSLYLWRHLPLMIDGLRLSL